MLSSAGQSGDVLQKEFCISKTMEKNCCEKLHNPCDAEARIFRVNLVDTMAADALTPCVTRSSATMILIM